MDMQFVYTKIMSRKLGIIDNRDILIVMKICTITLCDIIDPFYSSIIAISIQPKLHEAVMNNNFET